MNTSVIKIFIIENQWAEFKAIADYCTEKMRWQVLMGSMDSPLLYKKGDNIMPAIFSALADKIRIYVNAKYPSTYSEEAFKTIRDVARQADLIIMDHLLGGAYRCDTGINIARRLAGLKDHDSQSGRTISHEEEVIEYHRVKPVLFLSKTEANAEKRLKDYEDYKLDITKKFNVSDIDAHTLWIHKGFYGDEIILSDPYMKQEVINNAEKLLNQNLVARKQRLVNKWEKLLYAPCIEMFPNADAQQAKDKLARFKESEFFEHLSTLEECLLDCDASAGADVVFYALRKAIALI